MEHRRKLGTENPPRSDLSFRKRSLVYVKEAKMKPATQNTARNHFSAYMHNQQAKTNRINEF